MDRKKKDELVMGADVQSCQPCRAKVDDTWNVGPGHLSRTVQRSESWGVHKLPQRQRRAEHILSLATEKTLVLVDENKDSVYQETTLPIAGSVAYGQPPHRYKTSFSYRLLFSLSQLFRSKPLPQQSKFLVPENLNNPSYLVRLGREIEGELQSQGEALWSKPGSPSQEVALTFEREDKSSSLEVHVANDLEAGHSVGSYPSTGHNQWQEKDTPAFGGGKSHVSDAYGVVHHLEQGFRENIPQKCIAIPTTQPQTLTRLCEISSYCESNKQLDHIATDTANKTNSSSPEKPVMQDVNSHTVHGPRDGNTGVPTGYEDPEAEHGISNVLQNIPVELSQTGFAYALPKEQAISIENDVSLSEQGLKGNFPRRSVGSWQDEAGCSTSVKNSVSSSSPLMNRLPIIPAVVIRSNNFVSCSFDDEEESPTAAVHCPSICNYEIEHEGMFPQSRLLHSSSDSDISIRNVSNSKNNHGSSMSTRREELNCIHRLRHSACEGHMCSNCNFPYGPAQVWKVKKRLQQNFLDPLDKDFDLSCRSSEAKELFLRDRYPVSTENSLEMLDLQETETSITSFAPPESNAKGFKSRSVPPPFFSRSVHKHKNKRRSSQKRPFSTSRSISDHDPRSVPVHRNACRMPDRFSKIQYINPLDRKLVPHLQYSVTPEQKCSTSCQSKTISKSKTRSTENIRKDSIILSEKPPVHKSKAYSENTLSYQTNRETRCSAFREIGASCSVIRPLASSGRGEDSACSLAKCRAGDNSGKSLAISENETCAAGACAKAQDAEDLEVELLSAGFDGCGNGRRQLKQACNCIGMCGTRSACGAQRSEVSCNRSVHKKCLYHFCKQQLKDELDVHERQALLCRKEGGKCNRTGFQRCRPGDKVKCAKETLGKTRKENSRLDDDDDACPFKRGQCWAADVAHRIMQKAEEYVKSGSPSCVKYPASCAMKTITDEIMSAENLASPICKKSGVNCKSNKMQATHSRWSSSNVKDAQCNSCDKACDTLSHKDKTGFDLLNKNTMLGHDDPTCENGTNLPPEQSVATNLRQPTSIFNHSVSSLKHETSLPGALREKAPLVKAIGSSKTGTTSGREKNVRDAMTSPAIVLVEKHETAGVNRSMKSNLLAVDSIRSAPATFVNPSEAASRIPGSTSGLLGYRQIHVTVTDHTEGAGSPWGSNDTCTEGAMSRSVCETQRDDRGTRAKPESSCSVQKDCEASTLSAHNKDLVTDRGFVELAPSFPSKVKFHPLTVSSTSVDTDHFSSCESLPSTFEKSLEASHQLDIAFRKFVRVPRKSAYPLPTVLEAAVRDSASLNKMRPHETSRHDHIRATNAAVRPNGRQDDVHPDEFTETFVDSSNCEASFVTVASHGDITISLRHSIPTSCDERGEHKHQQSIQSLSGKGDVSLDEQLSSARKSPQELSGTVKDSILKSKLPDSLTPSLCVELRRKSHRHKKSRGAENQVSKCNSSSRQSPTKQSSMIRREDFSQKKSKETQLSSKESGQTASNEDTSFGSTAAPGAIKQRNPTKVTSLRKLTGIRKSSKAIHSSDKYHRLHPDSRHDDPTGRENPEQHDRKSRPLASESKYWSPQHNGLSESSHACMAQAHTKSSASSKRPKDLFKNRSTMKDSTQCPISPVNHVQEKTSTAETGLKAVSLSSSSSEMFFDVTEMV